MAARETTKPYIRAIRASRSIAAEKEPLHFALQLRKRSAEGFRTRIDDNGPLGIQPIEVKANGLADTPPDTVAHDGFSERARNGETDMRSVGFGLAKAESREEGIRPADALIIDSSEILRSQETDTFRKTSDGILPLGAYRELFPAAGTTPRENGAAVLGFHPRAESVRFCAMTVIRLKSAFWHLGSII